MAVGSVPVVTALLQPVDDLTAATGDPAVPAAATNTTPAVANRLQSQLLYTPIDVANKQHYIY